MEVMERVSAPVKRINIFLCIGTSGFAMYVDFRDSVKKDLSVVYIITDRSRYSEM